MNLTTIATRNIKRRKGKVVLIMVGLAVAVATLVSIVTIVFSLNSRVSDELNKYGYDLAVSPRTKELSLSYGGMTISTVATNKAKPLTDKDLNKIKKAADGRINVITPKLLQVIKVKEQKALLVGVNLAKERKVKKWWQLDFGRFPRRADGLLVGREAADGLKLESGDKLIISGKEFVVDGILLPTGGQDDSVIYGDFNTVRRLFNRGREINLLEISANKSDDIRPLARDLRQSLPSAGVSSFSQVVKFKEKAMRRLVAFGLAVTLIIVFISGLIVFTIMTSSVRERRREIGIFRAVGYRRSHIAKIIFTEVIIIGLTAGVGGYALGMALIEVIELFNRDFKAAGGQNIPLFFVSLIMAVVIAVLAGIAPIRKAANMDPVDSLKSI